jgi:hypothetical protein
MYINKSDWSQLINVNFYFNTRNILQNINIMSSSPSTCGICDMRHISKPSEVWCPDCEEGICTECVEHHSLAKPSRNHTTLPISEYRTLPSYVLQLTPSFLVLSYFTPKIGRVWRYQEGNHNSYIEEEQITQWP